MSHDNTDRALASSKIWEKPAYEIIELGSEVTGYINTDEYQANVDVSLAKSTSGVSAAPDKSV